jgi:hypothetical protein
MILELHSSPNSIFTSRNAKFVISATGSYTVPPSLESVMTIGVYARWDDVLLRNTLKNGLLTRATNNTVTMRVLVKDKMLILWIRLGKKE